jgi:site-specific DNA recombinase
LNASLARLEAIPRAEQFNEEINRTRRDRDHRRDSLQREQKDLERRIDTLLDASPSGALKGPSVQTKLEALEARQGEVAKELDGLLDEPVRLHPNLAGLYRRKVAALQNLLENNATRTEAVKIIRSLVDQVILRHSAEAGLEVESRRRHREHGPAGPELKRKQPRFRGCSR